MTSFQVAQGRTGQAGGQRGRARPRGCMGKRHRRSPWSGQPVRRLEGWEKVSGHARYTSDVRLPGQLFARVLRSPHPHARIARIDTSAAEALPGVHCGPVRRQHRSRFPGTKRASCSTTTVRFAGDEVAAVAAESEEIAEDAIRLIEVEWEPLPHVTDLDAALEPDAPHVWPGGNITEEPTVYDRGDAERGLREADVIDRPDVSPRRRGPQQSRTTRLHGLVGGRPADAVGLDPIGVHRSRGGGRSTGASAAPGAGDQGAHGRWIRRQANLLEAGCHRFAAVAGSGPSGPVDARPGSGKPRRRQSQRHPPAGPPWRAIATEP